jgi:hypothetical protein
MHSNKKSQHNIPTPKEALIPQGEECIAKATPEELLQFGRGKTRRGVAQL